ncbi:MAG: kelch repeat-containing protein [Bryobacteraceae bacterium]
MRILKTLQASLVLLAACSAQTPNWIKPALTTLPSPRCCAAMAYDAGTHSTVLYGGGPTNVVYGDTWTFTRQNGWLQLSPASSPPALSGANLVYDPISKTAVLFGGTRTDSADSNETWTWDGATWTQQFSLVGPPARSFNAQQMVYDAATRTIVLFGGYGSNGITLADTWEWSGRTKAWRQKFPATSPSPRGTTLAYDAINQKVLLFGGDSGGGDCCRTVYGDTWTWDGATWTQQFPRTTPAARTALAMTFDVARVGIVLFGGFATPGSGLNDTWTWDGIKWSQVQTPFAPFGRWAVSMTFDPNFRGLVMFGGELTGNPFTNQTWIFR